MSWQHHELFRVAQKAQKDNADVEICENKFHMYFLLNHGDETFPLILSTIDYVITTLA